MSDCPHLRRAENGQTRYQWVQQANRLCDDPSHRYADAQHEPITHACPLAGSGLTPCCGRTPFELPLTDRMTIDNDLVSCIEGVESQ